MEPITREEYYLAKIAGTYEGKTPKPVTNDEYYLATMAGDYSGNTPQPVTRLQYYMAKVAGVWDGSIPAPVTRLEYYWAAIASGEGKVFPPVTREEHFLVLVADAYSVVLTVVTGNPALLEGVKGNRFASLTLHGKSTQESTTGAQLFDVGKSELVYNEMGLTTTYNPETGWFYTKGTLKQTNMVIFWKEENLVSIKRGEQYYFFAETIGENNLLALAEAGKANAFANNNMSIIASRDVNVNQIYSNHKYEQGTVFDLKFRIIVSTGSTPKPYEPYTGGAPSPSQSYPQEIENAGQGGEIGVTVTGTNLLPFEVGQKGNGFEVFADGVQVDVDKATDIYAVGRDHVNVEIAYDEYALMTAGKYYIYSDMKNIGLYVVVLRKGTNILLGGSLEGVAKEIEIMDGDKFRIFLRTTGAFRGKVKAMITRIPVNATSYEPYKPAQKLIIPTPNGLPGIPVSYGGNYTDEKGQQWVCDEVDFKKGVYLQRISKRTITSKDTFFKSGLSTNDVNYFSLNKFYTHIGTVGKKDVLMSNCFVAGIYQNFSALGKIFLGSNTGDVVYFSVDAQKYPDTETFKQWAIENGLMFLYQLADIVETHLTAEELSAYKTLRTYSPTTTVINDAGAGMSVGYAKMK